MIIGSGGGMALPAELRPRCGTLVDPVVQITVDDSVPDRDPAFQMDPELERRTA